MHILQRVFVIAPVGAITVAVVVDIAAVSIDVSSGCSINTRLSMFVVGHYYASFFIITTDFKTVL